MHLTTNRDHAHGILYARQKFQWVRKGDALRFASERDRGCDRIGVSARCHKLPEKGMFPKTAMGLGIIMETILPVRSYG
jgi:hypothetical protein